MQRSIGLGLIIVIGMMVLPIAAIAQSVPVYSSTLNTVLDEFDKPLLGNDPSATQLGFTHVNGDLVQLFEAPFGVFAPDTNGAPHFANTVIYNSRIGIGISPALTKSGRFGVAVTPRPSGQIFARVYNAPTLEEASFYADSQVFTVNDGDIFYVEITKTDKALDENDDDGDGLHNSWEKSYGTDPSDPDSDDDGVSDGDEHLAGTDPADPNSKFVVARLLHSSGDILVQWDSVPNKEYVVECTTNIAAEVTVYSPASPVVTATGVLTQQAVTNGLESNHTFYRVKLVTE